MLALVVGGAAAVDAVARRGDPPGIEIIPPFSDHAVDDVAVTVHQDRGRRGVLAIFGQQIRMLPARGFDQSCREIELRESRLQFLFEVAAQAVAPFGILAFGGIGDPAVEFTEKRAGMKIFLRPGDSIGSGHVFLSRAASFFERPQRIGIRRRPEVGTARYLLGL